ncbi:MAG: bifunctional phosphoglucose/phosphomannose isomerase [Syntrophomonadaceae bacterium]|nr:bifunctional phosphoglucose/phosphomannose isomerase [Syntrophomonadaceae bacterium]
MTKEKMASYLWGLPEQFAAILPQGVQLPPSYKREYRHILVSGLGGSAIGGDVLRTYAQTQAAIPVVVNRDYDLPAFIGDQSLVLVVSYSGNTEETLGAYRQAREKGATLIVVTSGGKLADWARDDNVAVVIIPGGLSPRAATGYLFTPLALILQDLGIMKGAEEDIKEVIEVLQAMRQAIGPDTPWEGNTARQIARDLKGRLPLIWGSTGHSEIAALRWKTQINENAKCPVFYNLFPELNHNEIVGFEVPEEILSYIVVVMLRDPEDHIQVKKRMDISKQIIQDKVAKIVEVDSQGQGFLARFYSLAYLGDYVSFYLAEEYGINPTPVASIDFLKSELNR